MSSTKEAQVNLSINGQQAATTLGQIERQVKTLNSELKKLPEGTDAFNKKAAELGQAQNRLEGVRQKVKEVRQEQTELAKSSKEAQTEMLKMSPIGNMLSQAVTGFKSLITTVQMGSKAFFTLSGAIAATGIGALVIALTALFSWFTKTDAGVKKFEAGLNALKFVTNFLLKVVTDLGGALFEAFENPQQALKDLGDFIVQNLINRFTAFGVILDGIINLDFKKVADGAAQAATGVENVTDKIAVYSAQMKEAAERGADYAKQLDEIDDLESAYIVTNAKSAEQIGKLILQARDRTKTEQERLKFLDRASALEVKRLNEEIDLANRKVKAEQAAFEEVKRNNLDEGEQQRKLAEAEANLINLRSSSLELQEKISIRRNALVDAERKKEEEAKQKKKELQEKQDEAEKKALDAAFAYRSKVIDLQNNLIVDEFDRKLAILKTNDERERKQLIEAKQLTNEMEKLLDEQFEIQRQEIEAEREAKRKEKADKDRADSEKLKKEKQALILEEERLAEDQMQFAYDQKLISERQFLDAMHQLRIASFDRQLNNLVAEGKKETLEYRKILLAKEKASADYYTRIQKFEDRTIANLETQNAMLGQSAAMVGGLAALLEQDEKSRRKHAGKIKALRSFEVMIGGAEEVSKIWLYANSNPLNAIIPGWGPAFAVAQTAIAVARTGAALNKINNTQFEKGGVFGGSRHSQGGNLVIDRKTGNPIAEMEAGEPYMILSRATYRNNGALIDSLLDSSIYRGGAKVKFETGGVMAGGAVPNLPPNQPGNDITNQLFTAMMAKMDMTNQLLANYPTNLKATVEYEQAREVDDEARSIEMESMAA
jgi:hypothetical protein